MTTRIERHYGEWLSGYAWTHWLTLTVDPSRGTRGGKRRLGRAGICSRSAEGVRRAFRNELIRYAEKVSRSRVAFAYTVEQGVGGDNPHIHALLFVPETMEGDRLSRAWRHGRATAERYDPTRGAAFYLSKTFWRTGADWDVSRTFPPPARQTTSEAAET